MRTETFDVVVVGSVTSTGTPHQLRRGISDNPADHWADMPGFAGELAPRDNDELRRILCDEIPATFQWLLDSGIRFMGPMPEPPHRQPRMHNVLPNSHAFIYHLERRARWAGVDVRTGERVSGFEIDSGKVIGVKTGNHQYRANATILASGDFTNGPELKARFMGPQEAKVEGVNLTATGDGQRMAEALGARILNGDLALGPELRFIAPEKETLVRRLPPWRAFAFFMEWAMNHVPAAILRPFLMQFLTTALAARFSAWPDFVSTAPGVAYAYIPDYRRNRPDVYTQAASLKALAERLGMQPAAFEESVHGSHRRKFATGPFIALGPVRSVFVHAEGGLAVDTQHRVLAAGDRPIAGLYAAGATGQGGLLLKGHGHHLAWAFVSGRRAGRFAAISNEGAETK